MRFPSKATVERVRASYPSGTRVRLVRMDDPYTRLAPGTAGTVQCVDDTATIHIQWDNGSTLGAVYGEDIIEKIKEENT